MVLRASQYQTRVYGCSIRPSLPHLQQTLVEGFRSCVNNYAQESTTQQSDVNTLEPTIFASVPTTHWPGIFIFPDAIMLERLKRDLKRAQREYERAKDRLEEVRVEVEERKATVERLQTALDVVGEYTDSKDADQFLADEDYSISEAAEAVLRRAEQPLSIGGATNSILEHGFRYDKSADKLRRSLAGVLSREDQFERVERGVYTLREVQNDNERDGTNAAETADNNEAPSA